MTDKESNLPGHMVNEVVLLEATLDVCEAVRNKLIMSHEDLWLYVYVDIRKKEKATLTAANAFGGKLPTAVLEKVKKASHEAHRALLS